jgi:hypothetical protein
MIRTIAAALAAFALVSAARADDMAKTDTKTETKTDAAGKTTKTTKKSKKSKKTTAPAADTTAPATK